MEVSVPSQFLNVLLTEGQENRVTSVVTASYVTTEMAKDDEKLPALISTTLSPQPTSSSRNTYSLERLTCNDEKSNHIKKNGLSDDRSQDLMKNFPKALLAECTVEVRSTLNRPEKLQQRLCFDARVSPVFSKPAEFTASLAKRGIEISHCMNFKPASVYQKLRQDDDNHEIGGDVLELIEAVYSDHESEDETEMEDAVLKMSDYSLPPDIVIKPESTLPAVSVTTVGDIPKFNFKCEHCPNVYPNRGALWQHSVATHSAEKTCECKICGRKFYRNCSLALHLKSHSEEEYCACKECGKSFTRLINLERHMKVHSDGEQLQCEHCDKTFSDRTNLLRHAVCHASPTVKSHHCNICGKSYKSQDHLDIHYQSSHASISCSVCGKSFSSFGELMLHDAIHTGEHRYLCKYCNKSFSQKALLKKHLIIHTGEQLKCNTCGIEFTQRSSLLRHVKRLHCSSGQVNNNLMTQTVFDPVMSMDTDDNNDIKFESIGGKDDDYVDYEDDIEEVDIAESET